MAQPELDSGYYLQHFNELLQFVTVHYQPVLTRDSRAFIDDFSALSEHAQQLLVRMLNRKGQVFSDAELNYTEIGPAAPVLAELSAQGFVAPLASSDLTDFWLRLTKDTLWQLLQLAKSEFEPAQWAGLTANMAIKKSQTKPLLLGAALKLPVNWLALVAKLPQRYMALQRQDALNYLYFLYFGRIEANLSLFTLRDLGIRQSGQFKQQFQPRFTEAPQALLAYQLAKAKPAIIELGKQLKQQPDSAELLLGEWLALVTQWPAAADNGGEDQALQLKRSERCYQLGKLAEQYKLNDLAISFYQLSNGFPASERLVRLYYQQEPQQGDSDRCQKYLQQLLADPSCDEEWLFAEDFYRRKFNAEDGIQRSQLTQLLHDAPIVGVDELYLGQAEQGLIAHYQAQGYTVFHGENNLWLALFGLWFWHELFEHELSTLHNPFERRPRNLASGGFYQQFSAEIAHKLQQLTAPNAASQLLAAITTHYGKANSLFYWHTELAEQLMPLLTFAPKATDGSSALSPILRAMAQDFKRHCSGYPDLLLIKEHQLQFIEVKAPGDKIQRHQLARLLALNNAGFNARIEKLQWIVDPNRIYVVLDVETTGGKAGNDRVIEIGAVKVQAGEVLDTFSTLINPQRYIPSFITRLTGINSAMVADAPTFADIAGKLNEFLQGAVFVAHNAKFDYGFIRAEFTRLEIPFAMPQLCTVVNMRRYYPGLTSYSLGNLCQHFDIKLTNHHRALDDASATVELLKMINERRCTLELTTE